MFGGVVCIVTSCIHSVEFRFFSPAWPSLLDEYYVRLPSVLVLLKTACNVGSFFYCRIIVHSRRDRLIRAR